MGAEFHDLSGLSGLQPSPLKKVLLGLATGGRRVSEGVCTSLSLPRVRWQLDGGSRNEESPIVL